MDLIVDIVLLFACLLVLLFVESIGERSNCLGGIRFGQGWPK
jgi:hypothetical protein